MKSTWKSNYQNNEIKIINSWFKGEKLYVNDILQDEKISLVSSTLNGHILGKDNQKINIKANLGGFFSVECSLYVNDEKIEIIKIV
ncbi:hypothetical protein [Chryseobacterium sp.]|uniref:hypothetical protein n=1 Tax=Chryseobacterium sp. TaxID=1871047 RepID=UPI003890100D